jgi:nicotinate-nucleotide--dimethylbenzimidazole phosphoribosyltransferase
MTHPSRWSAASIDTVAAQGARERQSSLLKPPGSLGRLEDLAIWWAGVRGGTDWGRPERTRLVILAGDHGIARTAATSAYPPEVTAQMLSAFVHGGSAAHALATAMGVGIRAVDVSVAAPVEATPPMVRGHRIREGSGSIDREDAMSADECAAAFELGRTIVDDEVDAGTDLLILGDMGIGNTTPATALVLALTGADLVEHVGRGTGIDDITWMRKAAAIRDALRRVRGTTDPLDLLQRISGPDLAAMTGALTRASTRGVPVLLDGAIVTACALVASRMVDGATAWWQAGHLSAEPVHSLALAELGLRPLVELEMRLGEGSGALTALPILHAAIDTLTGMKTFAEAGVSDRADEPTS